MSNRPDIDEAVARLTYPLASKREIQRLPEILWEDERVERLATGTYGAVAGTGLLAMTNTRMIFFKHGRISQRVEDFAFDKISSVEWHGKMWTGAITLYASGNKAEITNVAPKADGEEFVDLLRMRIAEGTRPASNDTASTAPAADDLAVRLVKLDELRSLGAISDSEHAAKRTEILDSL